MSKQLELKIFTPERALFEGLVDHVTLPGKSGSFSVFPMHAPIISLLSGGEITYTIGADAHTLNIGGGFVEVREDIVSVCAEGQ